MATDPNQSFLQAVNDMACEVVRFHEEFDQSRLNSPDDVLTTLRERLLLIVEELGEHAQSISKNRPMKDVMDELADVLFVALGSVHRTGYYGDMSVIGVTHKNSQKTRMTHYLNAKTGKILRRE